MVRHFISAALLAIAAFAFAAPAHAEPAEAQTIWRLLDYIAVDYPAAVEDGKIVSAGEFQEMVEFSGSARERIAALPESAAKAGLLTQASALEASVKGKSAPAQIASVARGLAAALIVAYPVPLAPTALPDLARGRALYAERCAACHGATGDGHGPA
ncbi:MAG TPA: c-type cytochrome, partial [Rhizomicrobium sp.]|nr:c-type cytochrome [Rhizomicrobium sp.]